MDGLPLPLFPALGRQPRRGQPKRGASIPTSDPPSHLPSALGWAPLHQTLTCGGWQVEGRSGPGAPRG